MKELKRNLVIALAFTLSVFSIYAKSDNSIINNKKVKVVFENVEKGHSLTIKDYDGIILHKEVVSKDGDLIKFFDFSNLKDGNYEIEVNKDYEILVKPFDVKNNQVTFNKNKEVIVFKPVIRNKENKVFISKINFERSHLNVSIYFNDEVILNEKIISENDLLNKVYRLSETEKGAYKVIVSSNGKSYSKDFSL